MKGSACRPPPGLKPRYNISPGQHHPVILPEGGAFTLRHMRWGLIPAWAKDPAIGFKTINARAETLAEKPAFKDSFKDKRCLIPADGFYEWREVSGKEGKAPLRFTRKGGEPFCFAGLWSKYLPEGADAVDTFTIITTAADKPFARIHNRMPVILKEESTKRWTDPEADPDELLQLLKLYSSSKLEGFEVPRTVNAASNDSPECIQPAEGLRWP